MGIDRGGGSRVGGYESGRVSWEILGLCIGTGNVGGLLGLRRDCSKGVF